MLRILAKKRQFDKTTHHDTNLIIVSKLIIRQLRLLTDFKQLNTDLIADTLSLWTVSDGQKAKSGRKHGRTGFSGD